VYLEGLALYMRKFACCQGKGHFCRLRRNTIVDDLWTPTQNSKLLLEIVGPYIFATHGPEQKWKKKLEAGKTESSEPNFIQPAS